MRGKFFIGLVLLSIIGSGYAAISAGAAQEIKGYWKPPKPLKGATIGTHAGGLMDIRSVPLWLQHGDDVAYNNGVELLSKKKISQAISEFDNLLNKNRGFADAYYGRGLAYALQGKYAPAIADFTHYLEIEKKDSDSYCNRGLALVLQGQYDQGLADLNKALELTPNDPLALYFRGFAHFKQGRADAAKADYEKALRLNPELGERKGKGQTELDTYPLILQGKATALAGPAGPSPEGAAHKKQALVAAQKGDYDTALAEFTKALQVDPKDAEVYNNRGSMYTFKGRYDLALADFTKTLELNPRYARAYYNRALAYYYQGNYDRAIADLTKAIELNPKDPEAYSNRGLAYDQKKDYDKAIDDFNMAMLLNPKLADAYFNKAVSCERSGRQAEAREAYAAFLRYAPPEAKDQIEQAKRRLQQ